MDLVSEIKSYKDRDYEKLLSAGREAQLKKLKQNEHKGGFDKIDIPYAYGRIKDEFEELTEVLHRFPWYDFKDNTNGYIVEVIDEAADICNFASWLILMCKTVLRDKE